MIKKCENNGDFVKTEQFWDDYYKSHTSNMFNFWLKNYVGLFSKNGKILELGCGNGDLSIALNKKGFDVTACDLSSIALSNIKKKCPNLNVKQLNISLKMPFDDNMFDVVIADLSLHYFNFDTTIKITNELYRILKAGGQLIVRVNSIKEFKQGVGVVRIEENFYCFQDGYYKRFFTQNDVLTFFARFKDLKYKQKRIGNFNSGYKFIYEISCFK